MADEEKKDEEKKDEKKKEREPRSRWFMLILYPDNELHQDIMKYLDSDKNDVQGFYIKHEPDKLNDLDKNAQSKEHYHIMLYYPNPRTAKGVRESFGKCHVVTLEDGSKKAVTDVTGYDESKISVEWVVGKKLCSAVSSVHDMAMYFLHRNYECMKLGKKEYAIQDIKSFNHDFEIIQTAFEYEKVKQTGSYSYEIIQYIQDFNIHSLRELFITLHLNGEIDLLKYAESHAYLIKNFM